MPRPFTEAKDYERVTARLPSGIMQALRAAAAKSGAALNTEMIKALRRGLRLPATKKPDAS